ncbi:glycoside hydrolase family 19 protein [Wenyingzhuangia sp. 2_MG-2023]|uniref:glycoside hydrolase family 19 protein n=1 Tax=Wenyingzhuangia sp. 2_MG-2023 TaxID=3062639 RepID=UPI0026E22A1A|nr:glycoside hydrolase family 19 protein [Wenyingzhuangia sp. 2_MG-2023]MDO6737089.1 glycoside hydrolase family 19 protein [Wenyingzhuangia sp. 2_MG-2023]
MKPSILNLKYADLLIEAGIKTPLRMCHLFTQLEHESGLKPCEESFNYSLERLLQVFIYDFDSNKNRQIDKNERNKAISLIGNPEAIANFVYANQGGNGDEASGDGWKFRGRGFIQITLRDNYQQLTNDTGIDFMTNPDLLLEEKYSMIAALWFWTKRGLNALADIDDINGITKKINGGYNGLKDRKSILKEYKEMWIL